MEKQVGEPASRGFLRGFSNGFRSGLGKELNKAGPEIDKGTKSSFRKRFLEAGKAGAQDIASGFSSVIGGALKGLKLGGALVGALAAPGALAGVATIGTSLVSSLISVVAAMGPAIAGAGIAAAAGLAPLKISLKLISLGFDSLNTAQKKTLKATQQNLADAFGKPVAAGFFIPLLNTMDALARRIKGNAPIQQALLGLGRTFAKVADDIAHTISSAENLGRIGRILASNNTFIASFGTGIKGLVTGFLVFLDAIRPVTKDIGELVKIFGDWITQVATSQAASGTLSARLFKLYTAFLQLAGIAADFGKGVFQIFRAAAPAGQSMLTSIQGIAAKFAEWTGKAANQKKMVDFFNRMRDVSHIVFQIIGSIAKTVGKVIGGFDTKPIIGFLNVIQSLEKSISSILQQMSSAKVGTQLVSSFGSISDALAVLANSGYIEKFSKNVGDAFKILTDFAKTDAGQTFLKIAGSIAVLVVALGPLMGPLMGVFKVFMGFGKFLAPLIETLAGGFTAATETAGAALFGITAPVAAVVAGFVSLYAFSAKFRDAIGKLVKIIGTELAIAFKEIKPLIGPLLQSFKDMAKAIGDVLGPVIERFLPIVQAALHGAFSLIAPLLKILKGLMDFVTGVFTGNWTKVWQSIKDIVGAAWEFIQRLFKGAIGVLSAIWTQVLEPVWIFTQFIWDKILGFLRDVWGTIVDFASSVWGHIADFFSGIWNGIAGTATDVWNSIFNFLKGIWDTIVGAVSDAFSTVGNFLKGIWDGIASVVTTVWNSIYGFISGIVGSVVDFITGAWNGLVDIVSGVFNAVWGVITTVWNAISGFFTMIFKAIFGVFQYYFNYWTPYVQQIMGFIQGIITTVWTAISSFFTGIWNSITAVFTTVWNAISSFLTGVWNAIAGVATTVWNKVATFFTGIFNAVSAVITTVWNAISSFLSTVWNAILGVATTVWNAITAFFRLEINGFKVIFTAVWNAISGFLSTVWNAISGVAKTVWNAITAFFQRVVSGVQVIFTTVWNAISSFLSGVWNGISSVASTVWNALTGIISTAVNAVKAVIETIFGGIASFVSGVWNGIKTAAGVVWGGIKSAISIAIDGIKSVIETVFGWIGDFLGGIWDGITAAASAAWDLLTRFILDPVNTIKETVTTVFNDIQTTIGKIVDWIKDKVSIVTDVVGGVSSFISSLNPFSFTQGLDRFAHLPMGFDVKMPRLTMPELAAGGIVRPQVGGMVVRIGEAGRSERVEPLDSSGLSDRDKALITAMQQSNQAPAIAVHTYIGETELVDIVSSQVSVENDNTARLLMAGRRSMFT